MRNEKIQKSITHAFATIGAQTERGGTVTNVSTQAAINGLGLARVGDTVTYADGTTAIITDGAGSAAVWDGKPVALVGSTLSNGDKITKGAQDGAGIAVSNGESIPGLFDPTYVSPSRPGAKTGGADA